MPWQEDLGSFLKGASQGYGSSVAKRVDEERKWQNELKKQMMLEQFKHQLKSSEYANPLQGLEGMEIQDISVGPSGPTYKLMSGAEKDKILREKQKDELMMLGARELEKFSESSPARSKYISRLLFARPEKLQEAEFKLKGAYQTEPAQKRIEALGLTQLGKEQFGKIGATRKEFEMQSKDFKTVNDAMDRIMSSAKNPSAAGDLSLIFNYMKVLDPGSTVREGEFATAQNSAGIDNKLRAKYNQIINGQRLAPEQRADFVNRAARLYESSLGGQKRLEGSFKDIGKESGFLPQRAIIKFRTQLEQVPRGVPEQEWANATMQERADFLYKRSLRGGNVQSR